MKHTECKDCELSNGDCGYHDDGCYFEYGCDEGDVIAWMPKPEPYDPRGGKA